MTQISLRQLLAPLVDKVAYAGIFGNGSGVWAATPGFHPRREDVKELSVAFETIVRELNQNLTFQYDSYHVITNRDGTIVAKNSSGSLILCQCTNCVVFSFIEGSTQFSEGLLATQNVAAQIRAIPESELF
jgi:hypothetical protein